MSFDAATGAALVRRARPVVVEGQCLCGSSVHPGHTRCPACLVADCRAPRKCQYCAGPIGEPFYYLCESCARRSARVIRDAVESGAIRPKDLRPGRRRAEESNIQRLQRERRRQQRRRGDDE